MKEDMDDDNSTASNLFRISVSRFSFGSPDRKEVRRSPRKPSPVVRAIPVKRRGSESGQEQSEDIKTAGSSSRGNSRSPKKQKRSYAPPEAYAHLRELQDHLKQDLEVVFCARVKNRRKLATTLEILQIISGGFTDTQLPPHHDFNLPDKFSLGLTNLIDRPTTEQTELSREEQLAGVPLFLAKMARYRPLIVCFVGIGIAKVVESSLKVNLGSDTKSWGLRPYKMVHPNPSAYPETLFFAAPSTSGLVTQFQRPEKARIFGELRQIVANLKAGTLSTTQMMMIPPHHSAQIPNS